MIVLNVRNVHEALPRAMKMLSENGIIRESRNGQVLRLKEPVATVYSEPTERVEFHPWRDSNPFFHFYESLWMLAGRRDVAPLIRYVPRMSEFSDDGEKFNAAYGHRWRHLDYKQDQLVVICNALRKNPDDRQQVLQIWDHRLDLGTTTKDHACNLTATLQIVDNRLDMVVLCRSNDVIWGCYGANAVHFSVLLEYMARRIGCAVGTYTQVSVNWHAYMNVYEKMRDAALSFEPEAHDNPYVDGRFMDPTTPVTPYPIAEPGTDFEKWDLNCRCFVSVDGALTQSYDRMNYLPFFRNVAWPIVRAHDLHKAGATQEAISSMAECAAADWRMACVAWLMRRQGRRIAGAVK